MRWTPPDNSYLRLLDPEREFTGDYAGTIPAAKNYGDLPMYLLRRY